MSLTFVVVSVVVLIGLGSWALVSVRRSRHDDQFVGGALVERAQVQTIRRCAPGDEPSGGRSLNHQEGSMTVRAKVYCDSIEGNAVKFSTVFDPDAAADTENARFTKATPWGEIKLGIDNPAALEQFEPGKSYYVDFTPVDEPQRT